MDMVYMKHPDVEGLSEPTTREAFEQVWSRKGWVEAANVITIVNEESGRPEAVEVDESASKDQLEALAAAAGVDTSSAKTKADLVEALHPTTSGGEG